MLIYFVDVKDDNFIKIFIRREIYLIDNFKINIFIENDIIVSKEIVLNLIKKQILINNCEITIVFDVCSRINYV